MAERNKNRSARPLTPYGEISAGREAWVSMGPLIIIMYRNPNEVDPEKPNIFDGLDQIKISIQPRGVKSPWLLNLTNYTAAELECVQQLVTRAIEAAKPICEELDHRAQQALKEGNDTNSRIYRPIPEVIVRKRFVAEHSARLQGRPDGVSGVAESGPHDTSLDSSSGEGSKDLLERHTPEPESADSGSQGDSP